MKPASFGHADGPHNKEAEDIRVADGADVVAVVSMKGDGGMVSFSEAPFDPCKLADVLRQVADALEEEARARIRGAAADRGETA